MKKFMKDFTLRGLIAAGFGPLIVISIYAGLQVSNKLTTISISQVNLNIVSSLILTFIAGGISVIFRVEKLSLGMATLIDAIVIYLDYLIIYLINNWIEAHFIPLMIFTIIYIIGYIVIWLIIHRQIKTQIQKVNQQL